MSRGEKTAYVGANTIGREVPGFEGLVDLCQKGLTGIYLSDDKSGEAETMTRLNSDAWEKATEIEAVGFSASGLVTAAMVAASDRILPIIIGTGDSHE